MFKIIRSFIDPKKWKNRFWNFIKNKNIRDVQSFIIIIAVVFLISYMVLKEKFLPKLPQVYNYFAIAIFAIVIGFVGIIAMHRKEIPGPIAGTTITGNYAIIIGLIVTLFFWGLAIAGIVFWFIG